MRTAAHLGMSYWDRATAQLFGDEDTYVLPDTVHTNIPLGPKPDEPAGWHHARGLLVHLCRDLHGTPIALYYRTLETSTDKTNGAVVTAIARDHDNQLITVVWRETPRASRWRRTTTGQLTVNGVPALRTTGVRRPYARWLARVAWRTAD